jgi:hypothetical protein
MALQDMGWRDIHEKRGELRQWADNSGATISGLGTTITATASAATSATISNMWFGNSSSVLIQPSGYSAIPLVYGTAKISDKVKKDESPLEWLKRRIDEMRINLILEPAMA